MVPVFLPPIFLPASLYINAGRLISTFAVFQSTGPWLRGATPFSAKLDAICLLARTMDREK